MMNYELRTVRTKSKSVLFDGNKFERIDSSNQIAQTARVLKDGKISTAASSKPGAGEELIKQAGEMVKYGSPYSINFAGKADVAEMNLVNDAEMPSKGMIDMVGDFVSSLRAIDERLTVSGRLSSTLTEVSLKTSEGFDHSYRKSIWSGGGSVELMRGEDLLAIYDGKMSMGPDIDFKKLIADMKQKLEWADKVVEFKAGAYPVIFTPREVGSVLMPIIASMNGQAVYRKISPWSDKLGQKLMDERFTLIDDATTPGSWASLPFDNEGTPTRKNALVQNGVIKDLLTDRKVAAQLGIQSSGNAGGMGVSPNYLMMDGGSKTFDELVKSINYGLIIDGTMGAWSGNPYSGIVTGTIAMGLLVENGKIAGRVKDCMFTINAFEHFNKHFVDCTTEREQVGARQAAALLPYLLLDEVVISTK